MIIQHNLMSINAHNQLGVNNSGVSKNLEKLSSGYRINRAADDASGLAVSEKMRAQITGLNRAVMNAQDGTSLIQTAEGALTEVHSMLNRMVELAVQSANGTYEETDRLKIESEVDALKEEIDRISLASNFNGLELLNGDLSDMGIGKEGTLPAGIISYPDFTAVADADIHVPRDMRQDGTGPISVRVSPDSPTALEFSIENKNGGTPVTRTVELEGLINLTDGASYTLEIEGIASIQIQNNDPVSLDKSDLVMDLSFELDGKASVVPREGQTGLVLQVGDTSDSFNKMKISIDDMSSDGLEISNISMTTQEAASAALKQVKSAIEYVSINRGNLGALQNRLEHTIQNLTTTTENVTAAESRIRDVDMAKEMMQFTKNNVLSQASQAMLAQANMQPQQVLQLLQ